jgi:hypothetical protein
MVGNAGNINSTVGTTSATFLSWNPVLIADCILLIMILNTVRNHDVSDGQTWRLALETSDSVHLTDYFSCCKRKAIDLYLGDVEFESRKVHLLPLIFLGLSESVHKNAVIDQDCLMPSQMHHSSVILPFGAAQKSFTTVFHEGTPKTNFHIPRNPRIWKCLLLTSSIEKSSENLTGPQQVKKLPAFYGTRSIFWGIKII